MRALLDDGTTVELGDGSFAGDATTLSVTPPANLAVGSVRWQVLRRLHNTTMDSSGVVIELAPSDSVGNSVRLAPAPHMAAYASRTGVQIVRENFEPTEVALLLDQGQVDLPYLSGPKVQPVVFSSDLSRLYVAGSVAGQGVVYVVDTIAMRQIGRIDIPAGEGHNIDSLAIAGNILLIGEGSAFGGTGGTSGGGSGNRLLMLNTNPASASCNQVVSVKGSGIEATPHGIAGMAVGPDGYTLGVYRSAALNCCIGPAWPGTATGSIAAAEGHPRREWTLPTPRLPPLPQQNAQ